MKGPLLYTIMFTCALLLFWRNGPIGTTAVAMMSGGDGMADLVGRNVGQSKAAMEQAEDMGWKHRHVPE